MTIRVHGITDTSGAVSVFPTTSKPVYVVAQRGTAPTATEETIFDVYSTVDAASKWGADALAIKLVDILIKNGVSKIKGIMTKATGEPNPTLAETFDTALSKLLVETEIGIIITDQTDTTVIDKVKSHLILAEAEDIFRYAVLGAPAASDNTALGTLAGSINNSRIFLAGPQVVDESNIELSGIYTAAGIAGAIATQTSDPALPMNGVELMGFGGVSRILLQSEKDSLIAAGVIPLFTSPSGNPTIYRLVTTYTKDAQAEADVTWQEGTTRFIADDVLNSVQKRIRTNYKRTKNVVRKLQSMRTDVIDVLDGKVGLEILESYDNVTVLKDLNDLYGALIDYEFDVVTPLYTVTVTQHMKL